MVVKIFLLLLLAVPFTQAVAPEISKHPKDATRVEGQDVVFSCLVEGNPSPSVRWTKDGERLNTTTANSRLTESVSNNNHTLTITGVHRSDAGQYRCMANNSVDSSTSTAAVLKIYFKPEFTSNPQNITKIEGESVTLRCTVAGNPAPDVKWTKDGQTLNGPGVTSTGNTSSLTITIVKRGYQGLYRCVANNSVETSTSNPGILTVNFAPEVTINGDQKQFVPVRNEILLTCRYNASPPVSEVQWIKDGTTAIARNGSLEISDSRVTIPHYNESQVQLLITTATSQDAGNYTCLVINYVGNFSYTTSIVIQVAPDQPFNVKVDSKSSRMVNISWMAGFDGNSAILDYTVKISVNNTDFIDAVCQGSSTNSACVLANSFTSASLENLFPWTTYYIRVFARNKIDTSTGSSVVNTTTDEEVPSVPPTFNVNVINSTAVIVSWQMLMKEQARGAILGYYVSYKTELGNDVWVNRTVDGADTKSYLVTSLKKFTSYKVVMQAFNSKGASPRSGAVVKITDQDKPDGAPENVRGQKRSSTAILVMWGNVPADLQNGNITGYIIYFQSQTQNHNGNVSATYSEREKELAKLKKYVNYNITVTASTVKGEGPHSAPVEVVRTEQDIPHGAPQNVRGQNSSSTSILVEWDEVPAEEQNGVIKGYTITYKSQTENHNGHVQASSSVNQKELTNLKEYVNYTITVLAFTVKGNGPPSYPAIVVITDQDKPSGTPQNLTLNDTTSTSILVVWNVVPANDRNGIIISYTVSYQAISGDGSNTSIHTTTVDADALQANLIGLVKSQEYRIRVLASTIKGDGNYSDPITDQTNQDKPGAAPEGLEGHNLTSTSILVTWGEVPVGKQHGHIRHYTVIYKKVPGGTDQIKTVTDKRVELKDLDRFSVYNIRVLAATIKGDGPPSDPIFVSTDQDKPSAAPSLIVVKTLDSTSILVEWEPVPLQYRHGYITKYVIHYTDEIEKGEMNVPAPALKATINGLKQSTTYTIQVLAATVKGNGPLSDPKTAKTEDPPTPPSPPSDDDIGTTQVSINFVNKQTLSNGKPVMFYQIIAIPITEGQNPGKSSDGKYVRVTRNYDDQVEGEAYVTAEFANEKSQRTTFPVGDEKYYSRAGVTANRRKRRDTSRSSEERRKRRDTSYPKYLNGKLNDGTKYAVFQRSFHNDDEYENEGFIMFTTKVELLTIVVVSVVVGLLILIIVVIIVRRRFHRNVTKTSSRNSQHCSTQEILEMSASVNLATSQSAYCNPSTDPSYYYDINLSHYTEPTTEGQATYEEIHGQVDNYDDVVPKQEDIYQEIDQETHYQPLNLNREVYYEGFVKPTKPTIGSTS